MSREPRSSISTTIRLFLGIIGFFLIAFPAQAGKLQFWRFDVNRNRLEFRTDQGVKPQSQLIANPTRLVIDLPGTMLGRPSISQNLDGNIRAIRVSQFNSETTRIVVEVAPGYTLDPTKVRFDGATPNHWVVQLPQPQPGDINSTGATTAPIIQSSRLSNPGQIADLEVTSSGLRIVALGTKPQVGVKRSDDRKQIEIDLAGLTLPAALSQRRFTLNRFGISQLEVTQLVDRLSVVRLTLQVDKESPDWEVSFDNQGGIVIVPQGGVPARLNNSPAQGTLSLIKGADSIQTAPPAMRLATIQEVDLGSNQMLIRADQPLFYTVRREGSSYRITFRSAQLSEQIQPPRIGSGSSLSQIQIQQDAPGTVSIGLTPATGVQILGLKRFGAQSLLLQLYRPGALATSPSDLQPQPSSNVTPIPQSPSPLPLPISRKIVVIDPGHGGPDVGAVGIGGLRETDVVLDIGLEVARLLQQQGIIVHLTRQDERDVDLPPRVAMAEQVKANVFVSIHANSVSLSRPDINGLETYHFSGQLRSARLAAIIHNSVLSSLNIQDRGVRTSRFYVIRNTSMPSILIEVGFVTGQEDAANMVNPVWRRKMALAIAQGILQYLQSEPP
jgi:N-acetylmuramoyl-L-alanine amidase